MLADVRGVIRRDRINPEIACTFRGGRAVGSAAGASVDADGFQPQCYIFITPPSERLVVEPVFRQHALRGPQCSRRDRLDS
jgi:hypothetical protein